MLAADVTTTREAEPGKLFIRTGRQARIVAALVMALLSPATSAIGAEIAAEELRLIVPFPPTGPRDVLGADRAIRTYQAIARHTPPVISEAMADQLAVALAGRGELRVTRERVSRMPPARLYALAATTRTSPHTLVLGSTDAMVIAPYSAGSAPRDPVQALKLVAPIAVMPFVLLCARNACARGSYGSAFGPQAGFRTRSYASSGELSIGHLAGEQLRRGLGIVSLHVPYNGGNAALGGIAGGQVDWMLAALPLALGHAEGGRISMLGIAANERFVLLPELPTLKEAGLGEQVIEGWFALFAVPHMPEALITELRARSRHAIRSGMGRTALLVRGLVPSAESDTAFWARVAADSKRWGGLIDATR